MYMLVFCIYRET